MEKDSYILLLHKKMTGSISPEEAIALEKWRMENDSNNQLMREMELIWRASKEYEPRYSLKAEDAKKAFFASVHEKEEEQRGKMTSRPAGLRIRRMIPLGVAASILLVFVAVFLYKNYLSSPIPNFMKEAGPLVEVTKKTADQFFTLPDGTSLWLRPGSSLRYAQDFNQQDRVVYLHGEMYIHVVPDPGKPFLIRMEKNEVRVLGTSFYIRSDRDDRVELRVQEGLVELRDTRGLSEKVSAGNSRIYSKSAGNFLEATDQEPLVSNWRRNYLVFEDVPLSIVFDKLSIFYGVHFDIECEQVEALEGFTSLIQQADEPKLSVFLQTIEKVFGLQIDPTGEKTYKVYGGPCK